MKSNELFATILSLENEIEVLLSEGIRTSKEKEELRKLRVKAKNQFKEKADETCNL